MDLTVRRGEVVTIMGPSGSGKSTLLRLINHLEAVDKGEILVDGRPVGYRRVGDVLRPIRDLALARAEARIGMVFQHFNLFDHLTALENIIEAPIRVYGEDPAKRAGDRACAFWVWLGSFTTPTIFPIDSPAVSNNASRSLGRSRFRRG